MKPKVKRTSVKNKVDNSKFRGIDLFQDYEYQEPKLRAITKKIDEAYDNDEVNTKFLQSILDKTEAIGYTFELDMDGSAYGLRPIGVRLNQLEGFEIFGDDEYAKGGKFMRGGIAGDVYSLQNPEQFKQLITIYNDLSEKTDLIKGYYLDHTDNSMVFLTAPNISDIGKDEIYGYVESLRSKGFSIINFNKTINTDKYENGLSWGTEKGAMIKQSGMDGRANPQWFKLFLIDRIKYAKGGKMRKADNGMELSGGRRYLDYYLVVDIDERGEYGASVYNPEDNLVFSINDAEEMNDLIEMGYLESKADEDLDGLTVYLVQMKIIPYGSQVYSEAQFERMVRHTLEEDEIEYETNDECIEAVVDMARGVKEVADFFIVDGKLIIVFKNQLMTNEMDKLNSELQRIRGCGEVFEDSFEMGYGEGYKTITLELKTDDIEVGKFGEGGSIAEGNYHMILSQAKEVKHHVDELQDILKKEDTIEAWVVAKMENVSSTLSDITHYLDGKSEMPKAKRGMKVGDSAKNRNYWLKEILKGDLIDQLSKFQEVYENSLLCQPLDADYRAKDRKEFVQKLLRVSDDVNFVVNELIDSNYLIEDYLEPSNSKELASQKKYVEKIKKLLTKLSNTLNETYAEISTNLGSISTEDGQEFDMDYYQEIQDLVKEKLNYIEEYNNSFDEKPMAKDGMKVDKIKYPSISLKEKDLNDDQAEIYGFIENYEPLNRQLDAIRKNLMTKIAREQFDETKAPKIFMYLIDNGLKAYEKMHGDISLTKKEKEEIANNMVIDFMNEAQLGNYENETFLPKKYLNDGGMMVAYSITDDNGDSVMIVGSEQDVIDFANTVWYYDMMDEDGEEIDDFDVAKDYLEQSEFVVEAHNKPKSATKKKNVRRGNVK